MKKVIKINSIEEYKNKFKDYNTFQEKCDVMVCNKEIAEEILGKKLEDKFDTNIRCTHCGSTEFLKIYGTDGAGYFDSVDDDGYLNFKEEREGGSLDFMNYACADCYYAEFRDVKIEN